MTRTYVQKLVAPPDRVFPLLCPVREADWIEGWNPVAVWTESGFAEPDCVFVTSSENTDSVWFVTRHLPDEGTVEMLKVTPGVTACRLTIELAASRDGTDAQVTYSHTSLGPDGDSFVDGFTEEYYREFMEEWESRLNHYLNTGRMLEGAGD